MARPKKTPPPPKLRTAVLYARVSTREQEVEGYSLDAQLALLRAYALKHDFSVVQEFVESETAKISGRTAFTAMLKLIREAGVSAILVEKTDRLYRNLKDYVRVDDLDIEVHLVKENEVVSRESRSHQKFVHGIKLLVAKNYSDNLSEEAKKGMLEKARQGIWPTKAPLGYLNVAVGSRRVIAPDPDRSHLVTALFARYAEGVVSLKILRKEFTERGLTTRMGRVVTVNEIHRMLQNPVYHGLICWAGEEHQGIHEPLIDKATFERVQHVMTGRNLTKEKPATAKDFLYRGLFTCGECGCLISPQTTKGHRYYACTGARGCSRKTIREEVLTEEIAEKLSGLTIKPEVMELLRTTILESDEEEALYREEELERLTKVHTELRERLRKLYIDKVNSVVPEVIYKELKIQWETELQGAEACIEAFTKTRGKFEEECLGLLEFASNAYSRFKEASREDQREMARNLLSNSTITSGLVQVSFHKAFEMILEENARMREEGAKLPEMKVWLPD